MLPRYRAVIAWVLVIILWLTWTPTSSRPPEFLLAGEPSLRGALGNLLLFAPIGVMLTLGLVLTRRTSPDSSKQGTTFRHASLTVLGLIGAASFLVELGQTTVSGRTVEMLDVVLNATGASLAAVATIIGLRSGLKGSLLFGITVVTVFTGVVVFLSATGYSATRMTQLSEWNWAEHQLVAAEEADGQRTYIGTVREAEICGGPVENETCAGPGAGLAQRERLTRAAIQAQRVRLAAVVNSASDLQGGPTRIVSFSRNALQRNATLGQEGRSLHLRMRTPAGGLNGANLVFVLPNAITTEVETQVQATYRPGRVVLTSEDSRGARRAVFGWGQLSGWEVMRRSPKELSRPWVLVFAAVPAALALCLPIGIAATAVSMRLVDGLPLSFMTASIVIVGMTWPLGGRVHTYELLLCGASGALGFLLARSRG